MVEPWATVEPLGTGRAGRQKKKTKDKPCKGADGVKKNNNNNKKKKNNEKKKKKTKRKRSVEVEVEVESRRRRFW